jgi:hypothetical protein
MSLLEAMPTSSSSAWLEAAKQAPATFAVIFVVTFFLRYLENLTKQQRQDQERINKRHQDELERLIDRYEQSQARSQALYERVLQSLGAARGGS